ncbi:MAG: hypothetical protein IKC48_04205 [Clostridia bacterium]|nr:hypothetical protein [Clostridia bacterium]
MATTTQKKNSQKKEWVCPNLPKPQCSYKQLRRQVKAGNVPKEWNDLYDGLLQMIKDEFAQNPGQSIFYKELEVPYSVGTAYYNDRKNEAPYSPAILLNDYLTKRLKSEGYKHACMRLIFNPSQGSMWAKEINAMNERAYQAQYAEWQERKIRYDNRDLSDYDYTVASPGKAPTRTFAGESPYVPSKYVIVISCATKKSRAAKKKEKSVMVRQRKKTKTKLPGSLLVFLAYILPVVALAATCLLCGGIYSLINSEFEIMMLLSFAGAPIIIVGLIIGWRVHDKLDKKGFLG